MIEKADAQQFRRRLTVLRRARLGARRWWPHYLFHFSDLDNVVAILASGELLSRGAVHLENPQFSDSASPVVIDQTDERWKDYVRFYFRPKTPTLYRNEGFRPAGRRPLGGAHCPVPIYLLFDLESVICRADSRFSYGSLARPGVEIYESAEKFEHLPFDLVYHDSRFNKEERDDIIFHRHAEVVVPDRIGLEGLRAIVCRSAAEFETLRERLPADAWARWRSQVGVRTDYNLFNREWAYVDQAALMPAHVRLRLNPCRNPLDAGPFDLCLKISADREYNWHLPEAQLGAWLDFSLPQPQSQYRVELRLDGRMAYQGRYTDDSAPF